LKQHIKYALKLFGERIFFDVLTLIMIPIFIPMIHSWEVGPALFSMTVCFLYLGITCDLVWKLGKHDKKSYATEKHYKLKGAAVGLLSEVPFLLMYLLLLLHQDSARLRALYRLAVGPFMGFIPEDSVTAGYGLVLLIVPVLSCIFYLVGYRGIKEKTEVLSQKIVYKKK